MSPATAKHSLKDKNHPQLGTTDLELHIFLKQVYLKNTLSNEKDGKWHIMGSTSHLYKSKKIYIQSNIAGIIEGAGNQVNGHLDTLPVLFFPSKASSNTVQT